MRRSGTGPIGQTILFTSKLGLGVGLTYWLIHSGRLDTEAFRWSALRRERWLLPLLFLCQFASLALILGRWRLLLSAQGIGLSLRGTWVLGFRGMFAGLFLPGALGLDGARALYLQRNVRERMAEGLASMVVDRALGLLGLLLLAVVCGLYLAVRRDLAGLEASLVILVAATAASAAVVASLCGLLPGFGFRKLRRFRHLTQFVDSFSAYRQSHGVLLAAVLLSVVAHFLTCLGACLSLVILGMPFPWIAIMAITPLVIVVRSLPITPLGLGVSDGAAEALYAWVGVGGGAETQMLMRAVAVLLLFLAGLAFFVRIEVEPLRHRSPKTPYVG